MRSQEEAEPPQNTESQRSMMSNPRRNNTLKSTLSNIYTVLCIVLITIGVISLIAVGMGLHPFVMISESMHPELTKGSLVLLDTSSNIDDATIGDNVAYLLGKVEAMHKISSVSTDTDENLVLVVKSLSDDGTSVVTASTYLGKEVMSIPAVGGGIRQALDCKEAFQNKVV